MTRDWVGVVEAGYDLSGDRLGWLNRLLDAATPLMDRGVGVNAQVFRVSATRFAVEELAVRGLGTVEQLRGFLEGAPPEAVDAIYRRGAPVGTLSEWLFPSRPLTGRTFRGGSERYFVERTPAGFRDSLGLVAHTGTGWGVVLTAPLPRPGRMRGPERGRWKRVAAHLAAGLRLRPGALPPYLRSRPARVGRITRRGSPGPSRSSGATRCGSGRTTARGWSPATEPPARTWPGR